MRVLVYSIAYIPFIGGAEVAIREITDRIEGVEFDLITVDLDGQQPKQERIGNVTVYRIGRGKWAKYFFPIAGLLKGSLLHYRRPYQTVWGMMANYAGFAALFFKWFHPGVRYVLSLQEGDPIPYIKRRVRFIFPLFKRIFTKADIIQVISNYLGQEFARPMGYRGQIAVVPNGVDSKLFGEDDRSKVDKLREELGLDPNKVYLVTTSRLVIKNGLADVIKSLSLLPQNIHFLIIGSGPEESNLRQLAQDIGVTDRVHFLGQQPYERLPLFLRLGQIFVRPSLSEGMGNSFIEAMAAGIPIIATPVGGIIDFLCDGETGLFCGVSSPESIAAAVKKYLSNQELRQSVVRKSKEVVRGKYLWADISQKMAELLVS